MLRGVMNIQVVFVLNKILSDGLQISHSTEYASFHLFSGNRSVIILN